MDDFSKTYTFQRIYFLKIWILHKNKFCLILKVNTLFFSVSRFSSIWLNFQEKYIFLSFFLLDFPFKSKIFLLLVVILYKNLCKNLILRGQIFVSLQVILQLSLRFTAHLKQKKLQIKIICHFQFFVTTVYCGLFAKYFPNIISKNAN